MEHIRKALDLASADGRRHYAELRSAAPRGEPAAVDPLPAGERRQPSLSRYEYQVTTTFTPDPDVCERERVIGPASRSPAAEAFRMLRTQVTQRMVARNWRTIAVVSPGAEDGCSLTATNLAAALANDARHSALLVDLNLRAPALAARFGLEPAAGVDDFLAGRAEVEQCLFHPRGFDRLVLFPARAPLEAPSAQLASPRMHALVNELHGRYADRFVVFDLPPLLAYDDALAFLPFVDCALMVVSEGGTRRADLVRSLDLIRQTPVVGTVLNRAIAAGESPV